MNKYEITTKVSTLKTTHQYLAKKRPVTQPVTVQEGIWRLRSEKGYEHRGKGKGNRFPATRTGCTNTLGGEEAGTQHVRAREGQPECMLCSQRAA